MARSIAVSYTHLDVYKRQILDTALQTPATAKTLRLPGPVLICTAVADADAQSAVRAVGADIAVLPRAERGLDLHLSLIHI